MNTEDITPRRGPGRPPQRTEQRLSRPKMRSSRYDIDPKKIPDGVAYEWKRVSTLGQVDRQHQIDMGKFHWTAVPAHRHPELATDATDGGIINGGLMLMERPAYLTEEARQEDMASARSQLGEHMARLGQSEVRDMPRNKPKLSRSYETAIPGDAE